MKGWWRQSAEMRGRLGRRMGLGWLFMPLLFLVSAGAVHAAGTGVENIEAYRTFFGMDPRITIWIVAELHLMFGAFVLGVPIFAVIIEAVAARGGNPKYDRLAHEFVKLLSASFATTAALGGLLAFALFALWPRFMAYLTNVFHESMYIYAFIFFGETFTLYLYYYSWDLMTTGRAKWLHVGLGVLLNIWGTLIMMVAASWASFMMSPAGVDPETGAFVGTSWEAIDNLLWYPVSLHRLLGNIAFGGFICGAYAAIRFLGAQNDQERAHYDWMGYVGNFVGIAGLIPLPFAGYWLGREVYSASAVMGNNMMGGAFSWTFILQAVLIGVLFIGANYYLWIGMDRIPGSERYSHFIKYINFILLLCFAIWLTPHNLPLNAEEQVVMGGQYHPVLKYLGLMSAKNAVINFIILSTFFSFLLYRRANKGETIPISKQGGNGRLVLIGVAVFLTLILGAYGKTMWTMDPAVLDLEPDRGKYFKLPAMLLFIEVAMVWVAVALTLKNQGKVAQVLYLAVSVISITFILGVYGYVIMAVASPFLRNIALTQWMMMLSALFLVTTIDVMLFKDAREIGEISWGKMPIRAQYVLVLLCVGIVLLIGLMGFIRSGLREDWHIYGVLRDTSPYAYNPTNALMAKVVSACLILFLGGVSFVFWLAGLGEKAHGGEAKEAHGQAEKVVPHAGGVGRE